MATHFQGKPESVNHLKIGYTSSARDTIVRGQPVYFGEDADGNANRVIPVSDISAHQCNGLALSDTADMAYTNDVMAVALFPVTIITDNVDSSNPPEAAADSEVYILNAGTFSDADGGTANHSYGYCLEVKTSGEYSGMYVIRLIGTDT